MNIRIEKFLANGTKKSFLLFPHLGMPNKVGLYFMCKCIVIYCVGKNMILWYFFYKVTPTHFTYFHSHKHLYWESPTKGNTHDCQEKKASVERSLFLNSQFSLSMAIRESCMWEDFSPFHEHGTWMKDTSDLFLDKEVLKKMDFFSHFT